MSHAEFKLYCKMLLEEKHRVDIFLELCAPDEKCRRLSISVSSYMSQHMINLLPFEGTPPSRVL